MNFVTELCSFKSFLHYIWVISPILMHTWNFRL